MVAKKKAKRKPLTKRSLRGHSPELLLSDEDSQEIKELLKTVQQNVLEPIRWGRNSSRWDNLIWHLAKSNGICTDAKTAGSISARAKKLGYVAKLKKQPDGQTLMWFGGFEGIPRKKKRV